VSGWLVVMHTHLFFVLLPIAIVTLGNRTTRRETNSRSVKSWTGQLAD